MRQYFDMSPYQKNIWNISQVYPNIGISNIGGLIQFVELKDKSLLKTMCQELVRCQSAFRIRVSKENKLYESAYSPFLIEECDFLDKTEQEIQENILEWLQTPFSIYDHDLFEFKIIDTKQGCMLYGKYHHLILDGTSIVLAIKWQEEFYKRLLEEDRTPLLVEDKFIQKLKQQSWWLGKEVEQNAIKWFKNEFSDIQETWRLKETGNNPKAKRIFYTIEKELYRQIQQYCQENEISKEAFFYTIFYCYISKIKSSNIVVVGRVMANRRRDEKKMVGMMANTLPFKMSFEKNNTFLEICQAIESNLTRSLRYARYSQSDLEKDCKVYQCLYDILLSYRYKRIFPRSKEGKIIELFNEYCEVPLRIFLNDAVEESIQLEFQYRLECYKEIEIENMAGRFLSIIRQGLCNPTRNDICILNEQDKIKIEQFNQVTQLTYNKTIIEYFDLQVQKSPQKTALVFEGEKKSYQEVKKWSNQIANLLIKERIKKGDIVGICMERGFALPVAMLAILKVGAAFLPISTLDSIKRQKEVSKICKAVLVEKDSELENTIKIQKAGNLSKNCVDIGSIRGEDIAYLMYTSGSTAAPKAVKISHRSLLYRLQWQKNTFGCKGVILQKTRNTFDVSIWEFFLPLLSGETMCLLEAFGEQFPDRIAETIQENQVTVVHFVPSMLILFLEYCNTNQIKLPSLRQIFASGEALQASCVNLFYKIFPKAKLYNLYGPTECTIDVSYYICQPEEKQVPIGLPASNTQLFVVNEQREQLPIGAVGELCITGDLVGEGYYGEASKAYRVWNGKKAFFTGDIVKLEFDGLLYYLGRKDSQQKIRGMRVDLAAIEAAMLQCEGILQAVVLIKDSRLLAYYTANKEIKGLKEELKAQLPYYSVPSICKWIDKMPLNKNGKIDRKAFIEYTLQEKVLYPPKTRQERKLSKVIGSCLGRDEISVNADLLELGLDSLMILKIVAELETEKIKLKYTDFYEYPTISQLARKQKEQEKTALVFLQEKQTEKILLCIPYAGAEAECFLPLAQNLQEQSLEIASISMAYFKNKTVKEIAKEIMPELLEYQEIFMLGYCVGSALAVELAKRAKHRIKGITLCASLPADGLKINLWNFVNDILLKKILWYLHGSPAFGIPFSNEMLEQFRQDTTRYFDYMKQEKKKKLNCPVTLIFGTKDEITKGYQKKYKNWHKWIEDKFTIYQINGARHFFLAENAEKIAKIFIKQFIKEDTTTES